MRARTRPATCCPATDTPTQVDARGRARAAQAAASRTGRVRKIGHDLKFDAIVLARHGIVLEGHAFDSMLASYLLDATRPGHPLEETSLEHLGYKALAEEDLCGRGAKAIPLARRRRRRRR